MNEETKISRVCAFLKVVDINPIMSLYLQSVLQNEETISILEIFTNLNNQEHVVFLLIHILKCNNFSVAFSLILWRAHHQTPR